VPEWLKGADCKSVGAAYAGSNPASPTKSSKPFNQAVSSKSSSTNLTVNPTAELTPLRHFFGSTLQETPAPDA
jgi:hypothetical protein